MKCDILERNIADGIRKTILKSFALNKSTGFELSENLKQYIIKKTNEHTSNDITFDLKNGTNAKGDVFGVMITFTVTITKL